MTLTVGTHTHIQININEMRQIWQNALGHNISKSTCCTSGACICRINLKITAIKHTKACKLHRSCYS